MIRWSLFIFFFYKAYTKLGAVVDFRNGIIQNGTEPLYRNGTLPLPHDLPMIWNVNIVLKLLG